VPSFGAFSFALAAFLFLTSSACAAINAAFLFSSASLISF